MVKKPKTKRQENKSSVESQELKKNHSREPRKAMSIRQLITSPTKDSEWFEIVSKLTGIPEQATEKYKKTLKKWDSNWGEIIIDKQRKQVNVSWIRPDGGPQITFGTPCPANICILKFALYGTLIQKLNKANLLTFVRVGHPREWNRAKVFLNGEEVESLEWACALTGICLISMPDPTKQGKIDKIKVSGHVEIQVQDAQQTFF